MSNFKYPTPDKKTWLFRVWESVVFGFYWLFFHRPGATKAAGETVKRMEGLLAVYKEAEDKGLLYLLLLDEQFGKPGPGGITYNQLRGHLPRMKAIHKRLLSGKSINDLITLEAILRCQFRYDHVPAGSAFAAETQHAR